MKKILFFLTTTIFLFSCQQNKSSKWTTVKYIMGKPALFNLNLGDTAESHGDATAYKGVLKDTTGKIVGRVLGLKITVDIMDGDSANPIYVVERTGMSVFDFGNENEILVDGITSSHKGEQKMKVSVSQTKPIIGGTGIYKGVKGQITSTPKEDGNYYVVFEIKN